MPGQIEILVVGDTGGGKTSVINAVTETYTEVSSYPRYIQQCTSSKTSITRRNCEHCFIEVGFGAVFNDWEGGTKQSDSWERLTSIPSENIKLVLFVLRQGLITIESRKIFGMIRSNSHLKSVPKFCILTHCENEVSEDVLIKHCRPYFHSHGMQFDEIIPGCFARGGTCEEILQQPREQSCSAIWEKIYSLFNKPEPVRRVSCELIRR